MSITLTYYRDSASFLDNFKTKLSFKKRLLRVTQKHGIEGFTLINALGAWKGKTEPSYQLLLEGVPQMKAEALARELRDEFRQDAVMLKGRTVNFI